MGVMSHFRVMIHLSRIETTLTTHLFTTTGSPQVEDQAKGEMLQAIELIKDNFDDVLDIVMDRGSIQ